MRTYGEHAHSNCHPQKKVKHVDLKPLTWSNFNQVHALKHSHLKMHEYERYHVSFFYKLLRSIAWKVKRRRDASKLLHVPSIQEQSFLYASTVQIETHWKLDYRQYSTIYVYKSCIEKITSGCLHLILAIPAQKWYHVQGSRN